MATSDFKGWEVFEIPVSWEDLRNDRKLLSFGLAEGSVSWGKSWMVWGKRQYFQVRWWEGAGREA